MQMSKEVALGGPLAAQHSQPKRGPSNVSAAISNGPTVVTMFVDVV